MPISIRELHDAFMRDRASAKAEYLSRLVAVEAVALRAGESPYGTPAIEVSDVAEGELLGVFVLPFGQRSATSFARLRSVTPGDRLLAAGECRMFSDDGGVLVFKDCELLEG